MRKRFIIRLLLLLGVAGALYLTQQAPGPPAPEDTVALPAERANTRAPATRPPPPAAPKASGAAGARGAAEGPELTPDQEAKLAPLRKALEALTARARAAKARREHAVFAPAGEAVPEASAPPSPHPVDREGIQAAIQEMKPLIHECYEAWLTANADLAGKLTLSFRIEADPDDPARGRIAEAKVQEGGLGNRFLEGCVVASLQDLAFEAPRDGGVAVTYPFFFASNKPPPETP